VTAWIVEPIFLWLLLYSSNEQYGDTAFHKREHLCVWWLQQINRRTIAANIINQQWRIDENWRSSNFGFGHGVKNFSL
jgi:hypothetical protein